MAFLLDCKTLTAYSEATFTSIVSAVRKSVLNDIKP